MKKILTGLGIVVVAGAIGVGAWVYRTIDTSASASADNTTVLAEFHSTDSAAVKRGEYIMRLADCAACHTATAGDLAGGYVFKTGFGVLQSSNITPDRATGIGSMTEREFFNAVRQGIGSKGMLYPAMPYTEYRKLSDRDMQDLWAYMATVKPVAHAIDENAGMGFPYNIRLAMLGWDMLFFHNSGFTPDQGESAVLERGRYIVDSAGHCSACHTPRNILGAEIASDYLQGGNVGNAYAPDLTPDSQTGLGSESIGDIVNYLKTGANGTEVATGPMAEAVQNSTQYMSTGDLTAVATYLKSLPDHGIDAGVAPPPADSPAMKQAALKFEVSCSACHGTHAEGMGDMVPAFAHNPQVSAPDPTDLIRAVLVGGRAASTLARPTGAGMPSFAWKYSDQDIADILTYLRSTWGTHAAPVDRAKVADMRRSLNAPAKLPVSGP